MSGFLSRPYNRRNFVSLLLGTVAGAAAQPALAMAAIDPAEAYVSGIADEVMALANSGQSGKSLRGRFAALLNRYINLKAIANYALGTYRSKLPENRKDEFYRLVSNYSAALFVFYVEDFRGTTLEIMSNAKQGNFVTILSAIRLKNGGREQVRWRLVPTDGGFRVSDVNLKGIWLTISMKDRFSKVLKSSNGDFDALFAELRAAETW